ncbi:MAG: hypothetical protein EA351_14810 [Gemmatimonadales bacterium]|nr:MAG: hypothetical protein EA351_14810 [Gemmatimonadales bacterium]
MRQSIAVLSVAVALSWGAPPPMAAQTVPTDEYLNHEQLTSTVQSLVGGHGNLASVRSLAQTAEGRDVWLLTLGSGSDDALDRRPGLLIVANLEANHLVGSSTALITAEHLLTGYGADEEVTRLLDERTVYIIPRLNPDGAERYWSMPGYELPFKPHPDNPDLGGMNITELGSDLTGDGFVTMMRVPDPDGSLMVDPDEPRLLREANRARAERGGYSVMIEGIDPANVDAYVPMGSDGVNLNRNFPHEYLYYQPHVGPHQVSEPETRALADLMYEQVNIASVITFSPYDNLRSVPPTSRQVPDGVAPGPPSIPTNILAQDRPFYEYISEQFREITGLDGDGEDGEAGSFAQFAYYQLGLPSFTTPVWTLPGDGARAGAGPGSAGESSSGIEGSWAIQMEVQGQAMDASLTLERDGTTLIGSFDSPGGAVELEGTGEGSSFRLSGEVPQMGEITATGSVTGSEMSGSLGLGPMGSSSFTGTRVGGGGAPATARRPSGATRDHQWLAYLDELGVDGFIDWTAATHPELGEVEVGGFRPNARVNPPVEMVDELARSHADFAVWLGHQLPEIEVVETTIEPRGDNVFMVTATIQNDRYMPTQFQMGTRVRTNRPITVRLMPTDGMTVLTGNIQQQIQRLEGMGARHTFSWLVQAPAGTDVEMELFAERAGGLQSTTLTLR